MWAGAHEICGMIYIYILIDREMRSAQIIRKLRFGGFVAREFMRAWM